MATDNLSARTRCCIVGGGPAGMMLGLLMARAGVRTVVLEKHADFLRDFRGDTVHPSTLRVLDELGLLDAFLQRPHHRLTRLDGWFGRKQVALGDFSGLPERYAFIAMMPQWEFLDFLAEAAKPLPTFHLRTRAEATGLLIDGAGTVTGVRGRDAHGAFELHADCTIGCDGRHSTLRAAAGLTVEDVGAPIDVLWFRIPRDPNDEDTSLARVAPGRFMVTIARGDYWQCAFVIPKNGADALRDRGIDVLRAQVVEAAPFLASHVGELRSWDDVKLLTVAVDRLTRWSRPGLLCIGDAAHAMSPVGGVGINLAIQDAVATANLLASKLRDGPVAEADLDAVQRRRLWPTKATQAAQVAVQDHLLAPVLGSQAHGPGHDDGGARADAAQSAADMPIPLPLRALTALPMLQRVAARLIGMGIRPEHVRSPVVG